jgi:hypothetical protein
MTSTRKDKKLGIHLVSGGVAGINKFNSPKSTKIQAVAKLSPAILLTQ